MKLWFAEHSLHLIVLAAWTGDPSGIDCRLYGGSAFGEYAEGCTVYSAKFDDIHEISLKTISKKFPNKRWTDNG